MILTVTLNPSLDSIYLEDTFAVGTLNRYDSPVKYVGGKGINCARAASLMGADVIATGFLAGSNGLVVENMLKKEVFTTDFIAINGETRNAITIMHDNGTHTEIVENGPLLNEKNITDLKDRLKRIILDSPDLSVICLNGSANTADYSLYPDLLKLIYKLNPEIKVLADFSNAHLAHVIDLEKPPYFIKPNIIEFSEHIEKELTSKDDVINELNTFKTTIPFFMVSCGKDGAIIKYKNDLYDVMIPEITAKNPTGSGDSTVGGLAYSINAQNDFHTQVKTAMACGIANTLEEGVGVVDKKNVETFYSKIIIKKIVD